MDAIKYGIMAPSAHNRQPWKVKLVKGLENEPERGKRCYKCCDRPEYWQSG